MADRRPPDAASDGSNEERPTSARGSAGGQEGPGQTRPVGGFAALVDAFMSSFRQAMTAQDRDRQGQGSDQQPASAPRRHEEPTNEQRAEPQTQTQPNLATGSEEPGQQEQAPEQASGPTEQEQPPTPSQDTAGENTARSDDASNEERRTLYFRMPFLTQDGQSATLAFHPGPIPVPPQQPNPRPAFGPERPDHLGPERGNGQASGFHLPMTPIFVPLGTSPLPFSFIFDTQTNTAWPIVAMPNGPPGAMPPGSREPNEPAFIAGPPFHVSLNITFGPPPEPERPDPERAQRFVDMLEKADAELRTRMARLGMGAIGDYGGRQENEGGEGALGCGVCLDEYPSEDRPEWIGGQSSKDEEVVAVPCAGHHTLHHRCLCDWLAKAPPSQWTCPFCRAGLDKVKVESSASEDGEQGRRRETTATSDTATSANDDVAKRAEQEAKARSLRDEVRLREKARGWRCDSPACLPRYPRRSSVSSVSQAASNRIVSLLPCRHKLHLDCLCTSMRLEQVGNLDGEDEDETGDEGEEEGEEEGEAEAEAAPSPSVDERLPKDTVGKWVTCPTCRHEAWAELPVKRKSRRVEASRARLAVGQRLSDQPSWEDSHGSGDSDMSKTGDSRLSVGSKRPLDLPLSGARDRARLHDVGRLCDGDSDGDVEALLH